MRRSTISDKGFGAATRLLRAALLGLLALGAVACSGDEEPEYVERPVEELYDTQTDPHEIDNLAADPTHAEELLRLRAALEEGA